ncbi:indole-3-glycerol phosphate synthase [Melghiribacillus thermohalophilus]|uniref:Indole-3-glycerol phosphate synthase n=1 Tax=Melghiribacillus thermohalophilus TaxID=1324956 RepID=A0A4R3MQD1_9BACI|nr:indole-3-glycerol phosphate synthase TrpC [Melghiribacillus thermohalophilus]TCT18095.1 indole-3-glycerol phosphate synthase [Melghiribacillus thermohalophilus]
MLAEMIDYKRKEIQQLILPPAGSYPHYSLKESILSSPYPAGLIAEVKKASPSKGVIRKDFDPVGISSQYEQAGASAVSVLTDQHFFQGHRSYLSEIKQQVQIPVLRKDFIIDPKQVLESKRIGADAVLLIGEALEISRLNELYQYATELGMEVLVEVHHMTTLEKILKCMIPEIIGINNRNLETFQTDLSQTETIASSVPKETVLISESGIFTHDDVLRVKRAGAAGVLVGEALMRKSDLQRGIRELMRGEEA